MKSRGRRTQRRAEERRARKQARTELTRLVVPDSVKKLAELLRGR